MGRILYSIAIYIFWAGAWLFSFFNSKARKLVQGRKGWKNIQWDPGGNKTIWFHTASLGEFEQGRPLIESIKSQNPEIKIILTFFSPSGYDIRKNYASADIVLYLPEDTASNARLFFNKFNPEAVIFVKYEYWFHFLNEANKRSLTTVLASGIFRKEQLFFKPWGRFYRNILRNFDQLFVQNIESANLLQSIKMDQFQISGDTRFDRVIEVMNSKKQIPFVENFIQDKPTIVIGSLWEEDMVVLRDLLNDNPLGFKFIIAPHEVENNFISKITKQIKKPYLRYSKIDDNLAGKLPDILIIDNIGMLSSLYSYCQYAYVGGAFGKGLNNTLEAAVYGIPVFFGNQNYKKYQEAIDLTDQGGAFPVGRYDEIMSKLELLESDESLRKETGEICANYVKEKAGATEKILDYLKTKISL